MDSSVDRVCRRGCIVAGVEYRTANEAEFPAALEDVKSAIRFLRGNASDFGLIRTEYLSRASLPVDAWLAWREFMERTESMMWENIWSTAVRSRGCWIFMD